MSDTRRQKYYKRCQEIIDDLHDRVAKGEFISEEGCVVLYGKADYKALLHELRMMNAMQDWTAMTPAMEWLYHSQYFTNKAREEKAAKRQRQSVYWSAFAAMLSALSSLALCCYTCSDGNHRHEYEGETSHNVNDIPTDIDKVGEVSPTYELPNVIKQIPEVLNDLENEGKDNAPENGRKDKSQ